MGTSFGLEFGPRASSAIRRIAGLFAQRLCRSGEWATGRSRQKKVSLLRFIEPPGLRVGPLAHPRSAQPEPDRIGRGWCPGLGLYSRTRANSAIPRGIAVLGEGDASAARGGAPRTNRLCFCGSRDCRPRRPAAKPLGGVTGRTTGNTGKNIKNNLIPPRATAIAIWELCTTTEITVIVIRAQPTKLTACSWTSTRRSSTPAAGTTGPTVFSCVASRNKRAHRAFYWQPLPETGRVYPK